MDEYVAADQIDAYVVVYSVEDHKSFETAIDRLYEIRQEESKYVALILVANKTDLVRTRVVLEAGKRHVLVIVIMFRFYVHSVCLFTAIVKQ